LGSPFPNFKKNSNVVLLPSLSQTTYSNSVVVGSGGGGHSINLQSYHSPVRPSNIGIVMEMIKEEDL